MSQDDKHDTPEKNKNKTSSDSEESSSTRPSPVLARDVAADPNAKKSQGKGVKKAAPGQPSSPVQKLGKASKDTTPQKGIVLKEDQTPESVDTPDEEDAPSSTTEDVAPAGDSPEVDLEEISGEQREQVEEEREEGDVDEEEEEDLGIFLEEIFPDEGDLPTFTVPSTVEESPDQEADKDAAELDEPVDTPTEEGFWVDASDESSEDSSDVETEEDLLSEDTSDPAGELLEESEPVDTDDPLEPLIDESTTEDVPLEDTSDTQGDGDDEPGPPVVEDIDEVDSVVEAPAEDAKERVEPAGEQVVEDAQGQAQIEQDDEVEGALLDEAREDGFVPTPAVTIGKTTSPAAPLSDDETLPVDEDDVRGTLDDIGRLAKRCHMTSLAHEIYQERIPTLEGRRITLVVLGEFNHGKSTVINALLGDEVLPMGITPTTAVITHLVHADEPIVTVQPPHHGEPFSIAYDEMEEAVKESGEEGEEPEYVEIGYPNDVLKNSLVLVDTPGVNDISRQKVEITYGYLPRADVIVYVLDATQVLKKSEVVFIKDRLLKSSSDRIIFVLNKIDALSPEDVEEVVEYARERLHSILGPVELFTFSGRKALTAQKKGDTLPQDFQKFRAYLEKFVQEQRAYIILDSALAGGQRVATLMEQNLAIKRQGYSLEREDLEQRIIAVRSRLKESRRLIAENTELIDTRVQGIAATAKHNLRIFSEQFSEQLPLQIERADARDVKKFLPTWIQETYKEWLEKEGSALARSLEELAEEVIQITNESLQKTVQSYQEEFGLDGELDLHVDTVAYDVSVFALGAFGVSMLFVNVLVGSLLAIATPLLAYFFKERVETSIKERAREQGAKAIEEASAKLEEEILRVIHGYGDRLKEFVEMAGDRLYRQIEEALEQVQSETAGEDVDKSALLAHVEGHLKEVRALQGELVHSRTQLETWAAERYDI